MTRYTNVKQKRGVKRPAQLAFAVCPQKILHMFTFAPQLQRRSCLCLSAVEHNVHGIAAMAGHDDVLAHKALVNILHKEKKKTITTKCTLSQKLGNALSTAERIA